MFRRPLLPGSRIIALVSLATLVPLVALGWFGWRWLTQDEVIQLRRNVDMAAGRAALAIERGLVAAEERLRAGAQDWPPGAVTITVNGDRPRVAPRERVAFLPDVNPLPESVGRRFAEIASRALQPTTSSETGAVGTALSAYEEFLDVDDVAVAGTPAALAARYARCRLFERTGNVAGLRGEAEILRHDLERGRWPLTFAVYSLYVNDARIWTGRILPRPRFEELLAEAVTRAYAQRPAGLTSSDWESARRSTVKAGDASFVVLWQPIGDGLRSLVASEAFVKREWLTAAADVARATGTTVTAVEPAAGYPAGEAGSAGALALVRASESGLPWDLRVTARNPANPDAGLRSRRHLLVAGFALFSAMTIFAGYAVTRAVGREMAAARQQSEFLAAVSHEFRTPLTTLRQFTERLVDQPAMPEASRLVCLNAQSRATDRLTRLVESLLDVGRMEVGAQPYTFAPLDLTQLVRCVVAEFEPDARAAGREIRWSADDAVVISGDARALARAIWNLVDNAVKYSSGQMAVDVSVRATGDRIAVAVRDYGIGIPPRERDLVFRKFQRGVEARARGINGTGLGLAIVAHIVSAHHGRVDVESDEGLGSTFTVVLPLL